MVAHGDINYAVCDENIARAYAPHLPNIDIHTAISFTQFYSWGVSKKSPALRDSLNVWLSRYKGSAEYKRIYLKYMEKNNNSKNNHER
jgi:ABC-type amino acid transport substrate-binding protein